MNAVSWFALGVLVGNIVTSCAFVFIWFYRPAVQHSEDTK